MRKMDKVFTDKGIIFEADDYQVIMKGAEYDNCRRVIDITDKFIVTAFYSAVLDPEIHIFDRKTLEIIATQDMYPHKNIFNGTKSWGCYVF